MEKVSVRKVVANEEDVNRDPISGETGSHPLGTGAGALSAGIAGAALGTMAGPAGALVGAVVGAVVGGAVGHEAAESYNPTAEEIHWREYYVQEPYYAKEKGYEYYGAGFRTGWEGHQQHRGRRFEDVENDLRTAYERVKTQGAAEWAHARMAARSAWERVDHNWTRDRRKA